MKIIYSVVMLFGILLLISCKDPTASKPEERIVGMSNLVSDSYINGEYINFTVSADPGLTYGFDADASSRDVYVSVKTGSTNIFRITNEWMWEVTPGNAGLIASVTQGGTVANYTRPETITANNTPGSEKLIIKMWWEEGGNQDKVDISTISDDNGNLPISIYAKVYAPAILPTVNMYYLYGTATRFPNFETDLNRICSQAVCTINDFLSVNVNPGKPWDLNGNGKVDVYEDYTDANDESQEIVDWAGPGTGNQNYWDNDNLAALVLDQPIEDHSGEGALGFRLPNSNCVVLGSDATITAAAHEYMHSPNVTSPPNGLRDVIDEYNLMNYGALGGQVLRYRQVTQHPSGTEPSQWQALSKTSF